MVDAPVSYMMTESELREYIQQRYGDEGMHSLPERMARVLKQGTSCEYPLTPDKLLENNRAGEGEVEISALEIVQRYLKPNPKDHRDGEAVSGASSCWAD